jgi:hypothetical protein
VWLFFIVNAVWGLACLKVTRALSSERDAFPIEIVKWAAGILALAVPSVIVVLREAEKSDRKRPFEQFIVAVILGVLMAGFLGFGLELVLFFLGVRHFLGIPIWKVEFDRLTNVTGSGVAAAALQRNATAAIAKVLTRVQCAVYIVSVIAV